MKISFIILITSCSNLPKNSSNHKLPRKQKEAISIVYKYMQNKNLIRKNTVVSDSLVYSYISDFSKEIYSDNENPIKYNRVHDSLYNISVKTKNYIDHYHIKEFLNNKVSEKNAEFKLYFSKLHSNYIIAEIFDLKYNYGSTKINRRSYYGVSKKHLFFVENREIKKIYSKQWEYGL